MFGAFDADASHYFVPLRSTATLVRIDTATLQTSPLPTPAGSCMNAHAFVMAPDKMTGVLVCEGDQVVIPGQVVAIGVAGPAILGSTMTGMFSDGAAWLPPTP
jgi:hypothetical protein